MLAWAVGAPEVVLVLIVLLPVIVVGLIAKKAKMAKTTWRALYWTVGLLSLLFVLVSVARSVVAEVPSRLLLIGALGDGVIAVVAYFLILLPIFMLGAWIRRRTKARPD